MLFYQKRLCSIASSLACRWPKVLSFLIRHQGKLHPPISTPQTGSCLLILQIRIDWTQLPKVIGGSWGGKRKLGKAGTHWAGTGALMLFCLNLRKSDWSSTYLSHLKPASPGTITDVPYLHAVALALCVYFKNYAPVSCKFKSRV